MFRCVYIRCARYFCDTFATVPMCYISLLHINKKQPYLASARGRVFYITPCVVLVLSWNTLHMYSTRVVMDV